MLLNTDRDMNGALTFNPLIPNDEIIIHSETPFNEEIKRAFLRGFGVDINKKEKSKVPMPKKYIINHGATVLIWDDGEKTVVKRCADDEFNKKLGFLTAFFQHYSGMSKNKANKFLAELEVEDKEKEETKETKKTKSKTKFKVGDKVKVRNDLIEYKRYGSNTFVDSMKEFKGETVTISEINVGYLCNEYHILEDTQKWNWTYEMFETAKPKHMKGDK